MPVGDLLNPTGSPLANVPDTPPGRDFADPTETRRAIFDAVLKAAQSVQPISNDRYTLRLSNVQYVDPEDVPLRRQRVANLTGETVGRRLRGTWELIDNQSGKVIDSRQQLLARVPYMTPRGTVIQRGSEYSIANQMRLKPGIYTRVRENGEIEAHVNTMPREGFAHRYFLDPASGVFYVRLGQAKVPLMPLLRALGATDEQLKEAWGEELWKANYPHHNAANLKKVLQRFLRT